MEALFGDLYNIESQEQVAIHMCGFDGVQRSHYFGEDPIKRTELDARVRKLKNGKTQVRIRSLKR